MPLPDIVMADALRYDGGVLEPVSLPVSAEYPLTLSVNGRPFVVIACSGTDLAELALGHLTAEGIVRTRGDITSITVDEELPAVDVCLSGDDDIMERLMRVRTLVSACAGDGTAAPATRVEREKTPAVRAGVITEAMREFLGLSTTYRSTHGVHSAALYDRGGQRVLFYDEIGRHNAVDKLLGRALMDSLDPTAVMLLTTGRIASEIVHKAAAGGIPLIVTRAAPTSRALMLAREAGMTLVTGVMRDTFYIHGNAGDVIP